MIKPFNYPTHFINSSDSFLGGGRKHKYPLEGMVTQCELWTDNFMVD